MLNRINKSYLKTSTPCQLENEAVALALLAYVIIILRCGWCVYIEFNVPLMCNTWKYCASCECFHVLQLIKCVEVLFVHVPLHMLFCICIKPKNINYPSLFLKVIKITPVKSIFTHDLHSLRICALTIFLLLVLGSSPPTLWVAKAVGPLCKSLLQLTNHVDHRLPN